MLLTILLVNRYIYFFVKLFLDKLNIIML